VTIEMKIRRDEPVEEGSYRAVLKSMEKKETPFGTRILWLFEIPEHQTEVAGFTSLSESTQANAYHWATALNDEIRSKERWGSDDVVGKECVLDLAIGEDQKGREKNKIVGVHPVPEDEKKTEDED
jgi:hypothetical protein